MITTMNDYATPETFKPGERWLVSLTGTDVVEAYCLEWSPTNLFCKCKFPSFEEGEQVQWLRFVSNIELLERLPDESSVNQAAATAGSVEGNSAKPCEREDCRRIRQELTQRIIHEAAQEIPEGKTFTVATQAEIAAQSDDHGTD